MSELQLGMLQGKVGFSRFGELAQDGDDAAIINPNVPLPGANRWDRIVPLDIPVDWFEQSSATAGISLRELGVIDDSSSVISVDKARLVNFYRRILPATARPSLRLVAEVGAPVYPQLPATGDGTTDSAAIPPERVRSSDREDVEIQRLRREAYLDRLAEIQIAELSTLHDRAGPTVTIPTASLGESIQPVEYSMSDAGVPRIALVETWELRSFLGDYGLGRTLQTFSLLPGERTTITVETWRTEAATREDATSVFDSSDIASQTRFGSTLSRQSGAAFQQQGGWAASIGGGVSAGVNLGIVSFGASIQGGYAANHQEARQAFAASVAETTGEHAAQVTTAAARRSSRPPAPRPPAGCRPQRCAS